MGEERLSAASDGGCLDGAAAMRGSRLSRRVASTLLAPLALGISAPVETPAATPPPANAGVVVLVYHRLTPAGGDADAERMPLDRFTAQMEALRAWGYQSLSLTELAEALAGRRPLPPRAVAIQFDDGWRSAEAALPILRRLGLHGSFLIISGAADGHFGPDYLDWPAIRRIDRDPLFDIGSHTLTHPWHPQRNLVQWSLQPAAPPGAAAIRRELLGSRQRLEQQLGHPVTSLAWPRGWYTDELIATARRDGYRLLLTYSCGLNRPGPMALLTVRRCGVDGTDTLQELRRLLAGERPPTPAGGAPSGQP